MKHCSLTVWCLSQPVKMKRLSSTSESAPSQSLESETANACSVITLSHLTKAMLLRCGVTGPVCRAAACHVAWLLRGADGPPAASWMLPVLGAQPLLPLHLQLRHLTTGTGGISSCLRMSMPRTSQTIVLATRRMKM